jgi:hypothetical protein
MSNKFLFSRLATAILTVIVLVACGGGIGTGVGRGSGMGGTGSLTTVEGNVVAVTARMERSNSSNLLAEFADFIVAPLSAQTGVPGIQVSGGDQATTTDAGGNFSLVGVDASNNFVLTFTLNSGQAISLQIGVVPAGALVGVSNIVLNTTEGTATPSSITTEESPGDDSDSDGEDEDDESVDDASDDESDDESND